MTSFSEDKPFTVTLALNTHKPPFRQVMQKEILKFIEKKDERDEKLSPKIFPVFFSKILVQAICC